MERTVYLHAFSKLERIDGATNSKTDLAERSEWGGYCVLWKLQPIQIPPEVIFYIGPLPVTNALLGTWISILALFLVFFLGTRRRDLIPSGMQNAVEWIVEYLLNLTEGVAGKVKAR